MGRIKINAVDMIGSTFEIVDERQIIVIVTSPLNIYTSIMQIAKKKKK